MSDQPTHRFDADAVGAAESPPPPGDVNVGRVWLAVAARVWRREPGWVERAAGKVLRSPGLARALVTTPSLLVPWLIASAAVLATGAVATRSAGQPLVALLAPVVAGAGIAYAYGPGVDPAWELSASMAVSDRMVLLVRVLVVFSIDAVFGVAASAASGAAAGITVRWLVPMTAVAAFALAVATVARSANVGVGAGLAAWVITVLSGRSVSGDLAAAVNDSALVLPYLAVTALCGVIVLYATPVRGGAR